MDRSEIDRLIAASEQRVLDKINNEILPTRESELAGNIHSDIIGPRSILPQKITPVDLTSANPVDGSPLVYNEDKDLVTFEGAGNTVHRPLGIYQSTSSASFQTIADGAWEYVDFDDKLYDWMTASEYDISGGDNSQSNHVVVPRDGIYAVDGCCLFTSSATDHSCSSRIVVWDGSALRVVAMSENDYDTAGFTKNLPVSRCAVDLYEGEEVSLQALVVGLALALRSNVAGTIPAANYVQITYIGPIPT